MAIYHSNWLRTLGVLRHQESAMSRIQSADDSVHGASLKSPLVEGVQRGAKAHFGHGGVGGAGSLLLTGDATAISLLHGSGAGWRGKSPSSCCASNPHRVGLSEEAGFQGAGTPLWSMGEERRKLVWLGREKSPRWCGKAQCRNPRQCQRDATGERSVSLAKIAVVVQPTSCGQR